MVFGEVLGLKIQDQVDEEPFAPAAIESSCATMENESFCMRGLYGEIPGSSYEPIRVESWSTRE